jgi:dienelactone hydrolase
MPRLLASILVLTACLAVIGGCGGPRPDAGPWVLELGDLGPGSSLPETLVPTEWLVLDAVDGRGRRPLRPDAVYAAHLAERGAAPPVEGGSLVGEHGEPRLWERREADEKGSAGRASWAYTALESPVAGVMVANLQRGLTLHVNGEPYAGDYYGYGQGGVPVAVRAGRNDVYANAIRGDARLSLRRPTGPLERASWGEQRPDLVEGADVVGPLGLCVMNCTTARAAPLLISFAGDELLAPSELQVPAGLAPLEVARLALPLALRHDAVITATEEGKHAVAVQVFAEGTMLSYEVTLNVVGPRDVRRVTQVSSIDGTVQYHAVRPPADAEGFEPAPGATTGPGPDAGLVLSLHGAGVQARGQARSYSSRPDFWVVAATNRSPFGFDWQDWGRLDAYETLEHALASTGVRRDRVYLTGHSMGGHGSWHLAAVDPDGFAAVAPSAGWESFDSYGGRPDGALRDLWHAADGASSTLGLIDNLVQVPAFVLHGTADDNVPPGQAETMLAALREAGAAPESHFQEGAGHWWNADQAPGADCVDWPGIFELFRSTAIPADVWDTTFVCVDPGLDARHHGLEVIQARRSGEPVRLDVSGDMGAADGTLRVVVRAHNLRRLALHDLEGTVVVQDVGGDGEASAAASRPFTADGATLHLVWDGGVWREGGPVPAAQKRPGRTGPFKRAFEHGFALVVGTAGDAEEDRELAARARSLAGEWAYRANGRALQLTDGEFLRDGHDGHVILVGNADTNAAWDEVLASDAAVRAERGLIRVGADVHRGEDLAALAVMPRRGSDELLVGVVADSGPAGTRLHGITSPFTSGVGIPDFLVFDGRVLEEGDGGVLAAGFFDHRWRLPVDGK